jgi:hypothetical protein
VAYGRGANLPYFGKQGNILPYFSHEPKRNSIWGFPRVSNMAEREKEPNLGLFSLMYDTLKIQESLVRNLQKHPLNDMKCPPTFFKERRLLLA